MRNNHQFPTFSEQKPHSSLVAEWRVCCLAFEGDRLSSVAFARSFAPSTTSVCSHRAERELCHLWQASRHIGRAPQPQTQTKANPGSLSRLCINFSCGQAAHKSLARRVYILGSRKGRTGLSLRTVTGEELRECSSPLFSTTCLDKCGIRKERHVTLALREMNG